MSEKPRGSVTLIPSPASLPPQTHPWSAMTTFKVPDWAQEYLQLAAEVSQIADSEADPQIKYELIFSDRVSRRLHSLFPLYYNDPDMDYEDDVKAYAYALRAQAEEIKKAYALQD